MSESQSAGRAGKEIPRLFAELDEHTRVTVSESAFLTEFVPRVAAGLEAVAVIVWLRAAGTLRVAKQLHFERTGLAERPRAVQWHQHILEQAATNGAPCLVAPEPAHGNSEESNPTQYQLLIAPLRVGDEVVGLIETFQAPDSPPDQRGNLHALSEFCRLAGHYFQTRQVRALQQRQAKWDKFTDFNRRIHVNLDLEQTALQVANEGRLLIGCERLSVVVMQRGKAQVLAISGQEALDKRAVAVRSLQNLAAKAILTGDPIAYHGSDTDLAPQIAEALHAHLEESPMRSLVVVPLVRPQHDASLPPLTPLGALIAEQSVESDDNAALLEMTRWIAEPAASALGNALEYRGIFLLPVWKSLGRTRLLIGARTLPKTLAVLAAVVIVGLALTFIPAEFKLQGRGVLQPAERREIFAGVDGDVQEVHVEHGAKVRQGDLLLTLRNFDLEVQRENLNGQRAAAAEHLNAVQIAVMSREDLAPVERARLFGEKLSDKQTINSLNRELELIDQKIEKLQIRSPIDGEVVTWNISDTLLHRPLKRGEGLLSVVDPTGAWELEIRMPEERMGHVNEARLAQEQPLAVVFVAAHQPDQVLTGQLIAAQSRAEVRDDDGNTVLCRVAIDKTQVRDLRLGAEVTARVLCGRRAVGYVWFHDVMEFIQSRVLFRFQ